MVDTAPFIELGQRELAPYIEGVSQFVERYRDSDREDKGLITQSPETHIRNMLAVGVLNRIMRQAFIDTTGRVIVLPDCLKNYSDWECSREKIGDAWVCSRCHPDCIVYESAERFEDDHTDIVLEPDDMNEYFAKQRETQGTIGVVGVACALTLLSGYAVTLKHGLPTQGVFLNYCSCRHHWADPPYNTSYSLERMAYVLGKKPDGEPDPPRGRGETYSLERAGLSPGDFYRRLDDLAAAFEREYLPMFESADDDVIALSKEALQSLVPRLITRDSA